MTRPGNDARRDSSRTTAPVRPVQDEAATKGVPPGSTRNSASPSRRARPRAAPAPDPARQPSAGPPPVVCHSADDNRATLAALVDRANGGDRAALADLRGFLDAHPEVWQTCGDIGKCAERTWLELFSQQALGRESIRRYIEQLRCHMSRPSATP